jgi:hypothetical protein
MTETVKEKTKKRACDDRVVHPEAKKCQNLPTREARGEAGKNSPF